MLKEINEILSKDVEEVIASPLSLQLLRIYSKLYLNGGQPGVCAKSQRLYYNKLKEDYQMNTEILNRTCVPNFEGLKYIPGVFKDGKLIAGHVHVMGATLTDAQAIKYLENGVLKESDFKVLPGKVKDLEKNSDTMDLNAILDHDNFAELRKEAKKLGMNEKNPSKDELKAFIQKHIDESDDLI